MQESIQEPQSNNDSDSDKFLILISQKCKEDNVLCLGNDNKNNKTNEIPYKKQNQKISVQSMSRFLLHHKNVKETKDGIWRMMTRTMKPIKLFKA